METYNKLQIIRRLKDTHINLFALDDFSRLFSIQKRNTLYKKIARLEKDGIIKKLIKGKYLFTFDQPHQFPVANFLYTPSYISLESALSFYGIITGFPYKITSVTTKKTKSVVTENIEYRYIQIAKDLYFGYEKKDSFLIADREKSLMDYLYLMSKGLRSEDLSEFDLSLIDRKKMKRYVITSQHKRFIRFFQKLKL